MSDLAGRWEGVIHILDVDGPIIVTIDDEAITVDLPAVGSVGAPVLDAEMRADGFSGRLSTGGTVAVSMVEGALVGEATWPAGVIPLDLRREHPDARQYLVPRVDDDGRGDGGAFAGLIDAIVSGAYPSVDNVLAMQHGEVVLEEYFYGRGRDDLHTFQSCTKSITSLVFGIAVDQGHFSSLDDPVWQYLKTRTGHRWIDEQYDATLHDLLRMSVGLDWNEEVHYTDPRNDNTKMNQSGDWVGYTLDRPLNPSFVAGSYEYQSGLVILLGAVLQEATGRYVDDLAAEFLFGPLGIERFKWLAAPDGTRHTGGGLFLRPRDMLTIGQLVLQSGEWEGAQLVSRDWIERSTKPQTTAGPGDAGHGYQWHMTNIPSVMAAGYGGQFMNVLPQFDAVVVSNAHDYFGDGSFLQILRDHVIPVL